MKRNDFLKTTTLGIAGLVLHTADGQAQKANTSPLLVPPYIRPGDRIGITSPAGYITLEEIQPAVAVLRSWGWQPVIGNAIGKRENTFGGSDDERRADLQSMLDNPAIKAILCARGGYGAVRIVDRLDWSRFRLRPKWIIGFSDITVLHAHLHRQTGVASIHSKMINSFPDDWEKAEPIQIETILSIRDALTGVKYQYSATANANNRQGTATAPLVGGNLKTLESLAGSASDLVTNGKILFVEDAGEYLYSIDRMFWNLRRSGKLNGLKGLIVGGFRTKPDDEGEAFGKTLEEIVLEKLGGTGYPVCFDFPVGHQRANYALRCGMRHTLTVGADGATLAALL